jgi:hypothetical protein
MGGRTFVWVAMRTGATVTVGYAVWLADAEADVPAPPQDTDAVTPAAASGPLHDVDRRVVWDINPAALEEPAGIALRLLGVFFERFHRVAEPGAVDHAGHRAVRPTYCVSSFRWERHVRSLRIGTEATW